MRRIRILRVLLPVALVLFVVLLVLAIRPRRQVHGDLQENGSDAKQVATGLNVTQLGPGLQPELEFSAKVVEERDEAHIHLEKIDRLIVYPEQREPLEISAEIGDIEGGSGERQMRFAGGVRVLDTQDDLLLKLPFLDVDEAAGEARSRGAIEIEGRSRSGRASTLVYGLAGQPTELLELELEHDDGTVVSAPRALLLDGLDDVELQQEVRVRRGEDHFLAGRLRLLRGPDERLRKLMASDGARGRWSTAEEGPVSWRAELLEIEWGPAGQPARTVLRGDAELSGARGTLAAATIEATRSSGAPQAPTWEVVAEGTVYLQGRLEEGAAWLRADRLDAVLDEALRIRQAQAEGRVRFEAPETRAEAERAQIAPDGGASAIRLFSGERRRARLVRGRTRVAADRIATDRRGEQLRADGRVEATLLGQREGGGTSPLSGLFSRREAVHFVASRLESTQAGAHLVFSGGVRGWQGDQNLSAEQVVIDEPAQRLTATDRVITRLPREGKEAALGEADFVQVGADALVYEDRQRVAVYTGRVRMGLAEGWMEAEQLEVELGDPGQGIREIRAARKIQIEFRQPGDGDPPRLISGTADRLLYRPETQVVRLFGDDAPATVRQIGEGGGTTRGRVLRYRVDLGTLEVDSGEQASGTIKTDGASGREP